MSSSEITNANELSLVANLSETTNVIAIGERQEVSESGKELPQANGIEVARAEVVEAVSNISDYVQSISRNLQFQVDDSTGSTIVTVLDSDTDELIRQIPSEEVVAMARYIAEQAPDPLKGLLVDGKG